MQTGYTVHRHDHHIGWDNANLPILTVAPGEAVTIETVDSSGGQLSPASTVIVPGQSVGSVETEGARGSMAPLSAS